MTNKLVVIINSLKVPKIKKLLLYEKKFLVPKYSCLQNPRLGGYLPHIPVLSVLCPQLNLLNPPRTKFLGTPLFDGELVLAPRPTPKLEEHPLSAVRNCLFNIFAATFHIGRRSSTRNLRTRHAVVTGTRLSRNTWFSL